MYVSQHWVAIEGLRAVSRHEAEKLRWTFIVTEGNYS